MTTLPIIDDHFFIDNSTLERYTTCPRSYLYYGILKRELAEGRHALSFGTAIHKGLEAYYHGHPFETVAQVVQDHFRYSPSPEGDYRNAAFACDVLAQYSATYIDDPFDILEVDGRPLVEVPFTQPLGTIGGITVMWCGKIDMVVKMRGTGKIQHIDHKTTSMMGEKYFDEFLNDQAQIGYTWAVRQSLAVDNDGFMINALCCRPPTRTDKGIEFRRQAYCVDSDRIAEWRDNVLTIVEDLFAHARREQWPAHTKWCVGKYGKCPYIEVCTTPRAGRDTILSSGLFRQVEWSPLHTPIPTNTI